jgi:hypothetical protein
MKTVWIYMLRDPVTTITILELKGRDLVASILGES